MTKQQSGIEILEYAGQKPQSGVGVVRIVKRVLQVQLVLMLFMLIGQLSALEFQTFPSTQFMNSWQAAAYVWWDVPLIKITLWLSVLVWALFICGRMEAEKA